MMVCLVFTTFQVGSIQGELAYVRPCIMVTIPQDIIYNIVEAISDDRRSLKKCALVSSSFLLPCRKYLFSELRLRDDRACQRLHQFLVENPVVQSFVKSIAIQPLSHSSSSEWNCIPFIDILRLSFCCLKSFSINMSTLLKPYQYPLDWNNDFSSELKDALSTVIHSSTLKTLSLNKVSVPAMLFLGINLTKLELTILGFFPPNKSDDEGSTLLTPAVSEGVATTTTSHTVVDHCICKFRGPVYGTRSPTSAYFSLI